MKRTASLLLVATAALGLAGLLAPAHADVATTQVAATRPAETKYPSDELVSACRAAAEAIEAKLDESFHVAVKPPFVVAGNLPAGQVNRLAEMSVVGPAKAMWKSYFDKKPDKVVTVLLFADDGSYRSWARRLFQDEDLPHFGYYRGADRTLVMNIATGTGTLVHELTHALIAYDFPGVPVWFNEGLASLHEQCRVEADGIVGLTNWRLRGLQEALKAGKNRPLRELLTRDDFYGAMQGLNYAQARYFVMYMQQRDVLRAFYRQFRAHHRADRSGVSDVEAVFGRKLEAVEKDLLVWLKTLRFPER